jgi:hypothetical protein
VESLDELNTVFAEYERAEEDRRIGSRIRTIGQDFTHEAPLLLALPAEPFETGIAFRPRVDRYGMVAVRVCRYSVPAQFIGRTVNVMLRSTEVVILHGRTEIARHPRLTTKGGERIVLDHFLEVLLAKPGALAGSEAVARPAAKAPSPRPTKRSGPRRKPPAVKPKAPKSWSRSCSCTGTCSTATWSPGSARRWPPARTPPRSSRWKPAKPRSPAGGPRPSPPTRPCPNRSPHQNWVSRA